MRARWAVLISGRGSNLSALLDHADEISVALVVSSKAGVDGVYKARRAGVAVHILSQKIDWPALSLRLRSCGITHICLAGFMRILPAGFVSEWRGQMINLHPSLLPKYPGLQSIESAHAAKDEIGVTVHEVNEGVDEGRIILQRRSLKSADSGRYPLALAEFYVHVTEQALLARVVRAASCSVTLSPIGGGR